MTSITTRLDHYAIAAADTTVMMEWYKRVLGLVVHEEAGPIAPATQKVYFVAPPTIQGMKQGMMIEIMPKNANARINRGSHDAGLSHSAWYVADFDGALAHLKNCGVKFLTEIGTAIGGGRIISFEDCESNMTQIVERV